MLQERVRFLILLRWLDQSASHLIHYLIRHLPIEQERAKCSCYISKCQTLRRDWFLCNSGKGWPTPYSSTGFKRSNAIRSPATHQGRGGVVGKRDASNARTRLDPLQLRHVSRPLTQRRICFKRSDAIRSPATPRCFTWLPVFFRDISCEKLPFGKTIPSATSSSVPRNPSSSMRSGLERLHRVGCLQAPLALSLKRD